MSAVENRHVTTRGLRRQRIYVGCQDHTLSRRFFPRPARLLHLLLSFGGTKFQNNFQYIRIHRNNTNRRCASVECVSRCFARIVISWLLLLSSDAFPKQERNESSPPLGNRNLLYPALEDEFAPEQTNCTYKSQDNKSRGHNILNYVA